MLVLKVVDGSTSTDGYLIVRRDEPALDVQALVGRTVCFTEELSSTGYVMPRKYLRNHGLDPDTDFVTHWSGNHEQVLRDLLAGTCDLGATFSMNYQTADQREIPAAQLRILAITGRDCSACEPAVAEVWKMYLKPRSVIMSEYDKVRIGRLARSVTSVTARVKELR